MDLAANLQDFKDFISNINESSKVFNDEQIKTIVSHISLT